MLLMWIGLGMVVFGVAGVAVLVLACEIYDWVHVRRPEPRFYPVTAKGVERAWEDAAADWRRAMK